MKIIDIDTWPRKKQYEFFKAMDYPHINTCFNLDISKLYAFCQSHKISITHCILFLSAQTANSIREFKLRMRGDEVVEHECVNPSYTVLRDDETFSFCTVEFSEHADVMLKRAVIQQEKVLKTMVLEDEPGRDDFLFISVSPWISFTSIQHPVQMSPVDSVPRLAWGKFIKASSGKTLLPYSVQVHHALADGLHIGKFAIEFQRLADHPEVVFKTLISNSH